MLTEQDKDRIIREETFRNEVKEQLDKSKKTKGEKVWDRINSPIFLWFLSSIVLGILSFSYANWDKQREIERDKTEKIAEAEHENRRTAKKLDAEISSRLSYFVKALNIQVTPSFFEEGSGIFAYCCSAKFEQGVLSLDDPNSAGYKVNAFPEYAGRNLRSLLLELEDIVPEPEKNEIHLAYEKALRLQAIYLREIENKKNKDYSSSSHMEDLQSLAKPFNLKRWGKPFTGTDEGK